MPKPRSSLPPQLNQGPKLILPFTPGVGTGSAFSSFPINALQIFSPPPSGETVCSFQDHTSHIPHYCLPASTNTCLITQRSWRTIQTFYPSPAIILSNFNIYLDNPFITVNTFDSYIPMLSTLNHCNYYSSINNNKDPVHLLSTICEEGSLVFLCVCLI